MGYYVPKIENVNNIKIVLGYAVKNRQGKIDTLRRMDKNNGLMADEFVSMGFIKKASGEFTITEAGDKYFKKLFGKFEYLKNRFSGYVEQVKNRKNS